MWLGREICSGCAIRPTSDNADNSRHPSLYPSTLAFSRRRYAPKVRVKMPRHQNISKSEGPNTSPRELYFKYTYNPRKRYVLPRASKIYISHFMCRASFSFVAYFALTACSRGPFRYAIVAFGRISQARDNKLFRERFRARRRAG